MPLHLPVLHDAGGLVAIAKPSGLESTGRTTDDPGGAQHHLQRQLGRRLWLVHQLDRDTSGVLLFVRRRALVAPWQAELRRADKRYLAVVHGEVCFAARTIDAPLAYDRAARRWGVRPDGKPARTDLRRLDVARGHSLLEARLHSGRTHQVRVHLAHLGHPLVGERRYREPPCALAPRHALHAASLDVGPLRLRAPLPDDLRELLRRRGLGAPTP